MVSGQIEESLRHEIESYVEGRLDGVRQEIAALQSQLNESLSRLLDRQSEVPLDGSVAASILEHLRAAHEEGIDLAVSESSRAKASSDMAIVKAAISEIDAQQSQADILKLLIGRASSFAPRVAFFVIKGDQSIGWRARGFEGTVGDDIVQQISFAVSADTAIGNVARSRETWSGGPGAHAEDHLIINRLGDEPPVRIVAVPLVVRNRTVAVLYADSANLDSEAINLEALETLVKVSGMAVELLAARSIGAKSSAAPVEARAQERPVETAQAEASRQESHQYTPIAEYETITPATEASAPPSEVAAVEPPPASFESVSDVGPAAETEMTPPAMEVASATPITPVEAAPISDQQAQTPPAPSVPRRRYGADVELPVEVSDEEERRLHNDARRFARLLVSEIKLYNERQVTEGRAQNDLYMRLREYIDRSREMYDKRVKPEVAQRYDYFHQELVNTLAEGDAAKLGSAYPGTAVSA